MFPCKAPSTARFLLLLVLISLTILACSKKQENAATSNTSSRIVATIAEDEQPPATPTAAGQLSDAAQEVHFQVVFSENGAAAAYIASKGGKTYTVYRGKAGKSYIQIENMTLSNDGLHFAYSVTNIGKQQVVSDGVEQGLFDGLGTPVYSPDSRHLAYEAKIGDKWHIVVDGKLSESCGDVVSKPQFSGDSTQLVYLCGAYSGKSAGAGKAPQMVNVSSDDLTAKRLVVSDLLFGRQSVKPVFGSEVAVSIDKKRIAAISEKLGRKYVVEFSFAEPDVVREGLMFDAISFLSFSGDGTSLCYSGERDSQNYVVFNDREEFIREASVIAPPAVRPDRKGVGVVLATGNGVVMRQMFVQEKDLQLRNYQSINNLVFSRDSARYVYVASDGVKNFVVANGKEGPPFDKVVTPQFSPDGSKIVYRARKDGKRFVVVADAEKGTVIRQHPAYEQVFPVTFSTDGKSVEYGVKDGRQLIWKVEKL